MIAQADHGLPAWAPECITRPGVCERLKLDQDSRFDFLNAVAIEARRDGIRVTSNDLVKIADWAGISPESVPSAVQQAMGISRLLDGSPGSVPSAHAGDDPQRPALELIPIGTLLAEPVEEADWLAEELLPAGGLSVLAGKPKAGKSTEARVLARCVARGEPWLGRPTKQGAVFYLALEEKRSQVRAHFERMGARSDDPISVLVSSLPKDGLRLLAAATQEQKPVLIIVDTLIRATRLKDINDYAAVSLAMAPYLKLARESGAHLLFVHHMGKGERAGPDGILGSTAIYATVDTALLLVRTDRYRTIRSYQRYGDDFPETVLQLDPETGFTSLGGTRTEVDKAALGEAIVGELQGKAGRIREDDILELVEGRKKVKEQALRQLVAGGRIKRTGKGVKGDPFLYSISGILPPSSNGEGESPNSPEGVSTEGTGVNSPSREIPQVDSPSRQASPPILPPRSSLDAGSGKPPHMPEMNPSSRPMGLDP